MMTFAVLDSVLSTTLIFTLDHLKKEPRAPLEPTTARHPDASAYLKLQSSYTSELLIY